VPREHARAAGLFDADGLGRRINRETVLLLGGGRALLMQLAHPLVAVGVADHSDFRRDPLGRLFRTLDTMLRLVFAPREDALAAARRVRQVHEHVSGTLHVGTAHYPAGTPYDARDPELMLWVHATLVDSALVAYERFVGELSVAEREGYWQESKCAAEVLGLARAHLPDTSADFDAYVRRMLAGPELEVTPLARELADAVVHPPLRYLPRMASGIASLCWRGLLPAPLRDAYALRWGPARATFSMLATRGIRAGLPLAPRHLRVLPHARAAERASARDAAARG
jgi:uncharacterized protein (DUF2236 family)